jgi:hypothetical protein
MPSTLNDTVMDLEQLATALEKNADLVPGTERFRGSLETALTRIRTLIGTQKTLIADKQKVTQDLRTAVREGRNLAIDVRAIAKGEVGSRSEKLVEFGVAPLRPRTRKRRPPQGPDELDQLPASAAPNA